MVYSSTNNLFTTIGLVAATIFFLIAFSISANPDRYGDSNKGFLENGGLYYIMSAVLFVISYIIYLISRRSTSRISTNKKV